MIPAIHSSDISDGWEREGEHELFFNRYLAMGAHPLAINVLFHLMTH